MDLRHYVRNIHVSRCYYRSTKFNEELVFQEETPMSVVLSVSSTGWNPSTRAMTALEAEAVP